MLVGLFCPDLVLDRALVNMFEITNVQPSRQQCRMGAMLRGVLCSIPEAPNHVLSLNRCQVPANKNA